MSNPVFFDHIEVHVDDISTYCAFLVKLFQGGRHKVISKSGTSMFASNDGVNIEIKKKKSNDQPIQAGFCNPCLRMENAKNLIENELHFTITNTLENPDGNVYFFTDHEGIDWHVKEHLVRDNAINW